MTVSRLCDRDVVCIRASASLQEAAALMCEEHVGALVVVTEEEPPAVVGFLTDRDLALDVIGKGDSGKDLCVADIARTTLATVAGSASLQDAVGAMEEAGVRRLLVLDGEGRIFGLVSAEDLLDAISEQLAGLARALRKGIAREKLERKVVRKGAGTPPTFPSFGTAIQ